MARLLMQLTVRPASPEDEQAVVDLWRACELVLPHNEPHADYRFALGAATSDILVALDQDHRIVGSVMVGHDGHRGWLYYVAAEPSARMVGIGRTLVTAAENWLRDRGVAKVQLMVRETNAAVISFYDRLGYEHTPRIIMAKWLNDQP